MLNVRLHLLIVHYVLTNKLVNKIEIVLVNLDFMMMVLHLLAHNANTLVLNVAILQLVLYVRILRIEKVIVLAQMVTLTIDLLAKIAIINA